MDIKALMKAVHNWSRDAREARGVAALQAMTKADDDAVLAELVVTADALGKRNEQHWRASYFYPHDDLGRLGYVLARRGVTATLPVLRKYFAKDGAGDAQLISGHLLLLFEGTAVEVEATAAARADDQIGWFRLWVAARLKLSPTDAFTAVVEKIDAATKPQPRLEAALDAGQWCGVSDPRWGDLAIRLLKLSPHYQAALEVMSRLPDKRAVPYILASFSLYLQASTALRQLARVVDGDALFELITPFYEKGDKRRFHEVFEELGHPTGLALVAAHDEKLAAARAKRAANKARKPKKPKVAVSFPFLFFGLKPADWFEHADSQLYIVCFQGVLDEGAKLAVARAVREQDDVKFADRPWRWGELDGDTWAYSYTVHHYAEACGEAFSAVHAVAPLREVIFGDLREAASGDRWTAWSRRQETARPRVPSLDPTINTDLIYLYANRKIVVVEGVVDEQFERARLS